MPYFQPKEQVRYALALWHAPSVGPVTFSNIKRLFPNLKEVFDKPQRVAEEFNLEVGVKAYLTDPDWDKVDKTLQWAEADNHYILFREDEAYPILLKDIPTPPPILYVNGNIECLNDPQIAMVGARRMTAYGEENAKNFATDLAKKGFTITSGLALGVDGVAHQATLDAGGTTIAVMATGIDKIYPAKHLKLAEQIIQKGCVITEMPLGASANKSHFPRRNRIISGLTLGTLVVEAAVKSGSLITSRYAVEQNREVFTIPGSIHNTVAKGCHHLLKSGAKCVESGDDILVELRPWLEAQLNTGSETQQEDLFDNEDEGPDLDGAYLELLNAVGYDATPVNALIEKTGFSAGDVSSMLLRLELEGYVVQDACGYLKIKDMQ